MTIDKFYPEPRSLLKCEIDTLKFLKSNLFFCQEMEQLAADADKNYSFYSALLKKIRHHKKLNFRFESVLNITIDGRKGYAYTGAKIVFSDKKNFKEISYYMAICEQKNDNLKPRIIRKFHFDYAPICNSQKRPHPIFHLQYGGELPPMLSDMDIDDSHLDAWLSEPRLCYYPLSLALLINIILKEFPDDRKLKLIETPEWRAIIRKNEELLLRPFFKECYDFLSKGNHRKLFINDFYYGN
jgi:hypothetical protein